MVIKEHISTDDAENSITQEENMAVWRLGIKTLRIQPYSLPSVGPYDVKIQIKAVGICGSDIHHFKNMTVANFVVKRPMVVLGHECAGILEQVGSQVKSLMIGDPVALEPGISCRQCHLCKDGRYNLCRQMKYFGSPPTNGALANQVVHPADLCFKLPDNVSLEEGAMCEPLSVGVHACRRAKVLIFLFQYIVVVFPLMAIYGCFMKCSRRRMWKMKWDKYAMQWEALLI